MFRAYITFETEEGYNRCLTKFSAGRNHAPEDGIEGTKLKVEKAPVSRN